MYAVETIGSFNEFTIAIDQLHTEWKLQPGCIWYRGLSSHKHSLTPRVVWQKIADEDSLIEDFLHSYRPLCNEHPTDAWQLYALMQHFRLPTRLLDWSKSPLVALFFALENLDKKDVDLENLDKKDVDPVVWAIDPYVFNGLTCGYESVYVPQEARGSTEGVQLKNLLPRALRNEETSSFLKLPLAIEPPLGNQRIISQQGCFTVHGSDKTGIEEIFTAKGSDRIVQFRIDHVFANHVLESLHNLGFKEDFIYQDLDALSRRIIRERTN